MKATLEHVAEVRGLIDGGALRPHFQPILTLADGTIHGHEALIRTPSDCRLSTPDALFAQARLEGMSMELELECLRLALSAWCRQPGPGRLFVNLSASTLVQVLSQRQLGLILPADGSGTPGGLVIELTEHEHVADVDALAVAVGRLRRTGAVLALDDFGDGRSSLRLWSELKPEIVKIDKYFTRQIAQHPEKVQTMRALRQLAETFGSTLVAEGIETEDEMRLVRDLGITYGQGWLIGRPQPLPEHQPAAAALAVVNSRDLAVIPERRRQTQQRASTWSLLIEAEPVEPSVTNEQLFERFAADESLESMAVVDKGRPVGLLGRQKFMDRFAKPYFREIYGRQPCVTFANLSPGMVDVRAGLEELTAVLTSEDQRYLSDGFVITENGLYKGIGRGHDLVRAVTESRIEAARHANPLTLLPGNIPLTQHIARLLESGREFVASYCDLNHFKPFNDIYGYWRGDEMIQLAARCTSRFADARRDFVGHVGDDDFVVLFQSADWEARCQSIVDAFNAEARLLYDSEALAAGGLLAEDRFGTPRFHPLTTMSIGVVRVPTHDERVGPEDVADAAAQAKRIAKTKGLGVHVLTASADAIGTGRLLRQRTRAEP